MDRKLKELVEESANIVFFGGAGVSTESGIPDFRSENGLYQARSKYGFSPEQILSHTFFVKNTGTFFEYYKGNLIFPDVKPNKAHYALAELEKQGKLKAIVTQNIDGLHQMAGSEKVYELHGSVLRNYCTKCGEFYDLEYIMNEENCMADGSGKIPKCRKCGHLVKPDVVLYEEALNDNIIEGAVNAIEKADMVIVGGTSLVVYPAAGLINYYHGNKLVLINKTQTQYDKKANLVIHDAIGKVLGD